MTRSFQRHVGAAAVAVLAGCGEVAGPQQEAVMTLAASSANSATISHGTEISEISGLTFPCGGESFAMAGTVTYRWHTTSLRSGSWMTTQHERYALTGTGTVSGLKFTGRATANTTQVYAAGGAIIYTTSFRLMGITQGKADNDIFTLRAKWVIDANGRPVVGDFDVEYECRG